MRIHDLTPHINYIAIGEWEHAQIIELHWCNDTISHAISYARMLAGVDDVTPEDLIKTADDPVTQQALIYGAIRCQGAYSINDFESWYDADRVLPAIADGLTAYMPAVDETQMFGSLDEDWPEARRVDMPQHGEADYGVLYRALKKLGYSVAEIGRMTWRGMYGALGLDDDDGGGLTWDDSPSGVSIS